MSGREPLSCAEAEPLLPLVADGALGPDDDPALFEHLAGCPHCQRAVATHDLIALVVAQGAGAMPRRRRRWLPLAAAALLAIAAGLLSWGLWSDARPRAPAQAAVGDGLAAAPPAQTAPAAELPLTVIAVPQADGRTLYLLQREGRWTLVDPQQLDGPLLPGAGGVGQPVRH